MPYRFGLYRPVAEERPFVRAHLVVRSRQSVGCYLRRLLRCAVDRASTFRTALCLWSHPVVGIPKSAPLSSNRPPISPCV